MSKLVEKLAYYRQEVRSLGLWRWLWFKVQALRSRYARKGVRFPLYVPLHKGPLYFRAGTTDLMVFWQNIIGDEYRCLADVENPELIIDCGANVGYSAAHFLTKHPKSHLIAIEPDDGNFELLRRNLAPYTHRCTLIKSGVWSTTTGLVISENQMGEGGEWGIMVREVRPGEEPTMMAVDIGSLLRGSSYQRIGILKIDIEGAEESVFSTPPEWIDRVDNMVIELHNERCIDLCHEAIASRNFLRSRCDELYVFKRPKFVESAQTVSPKFLTAP